MSAKYESEVISGLCGYVSIGNQVRQHRPRNHNFGCDSRRLEYYGVLEEK